jgi:diketogulonate reductase-like aldo/keto reductase
LGFGCVGLSGLYNSPLSHEAGCSVIKEAFDRGITFFDTSDLYGHNNDNEIMVGKVISCIYFQVFKINESRNITSTYISRIAQEWFFFF